ncbi:unnamed protein product [Boreogadus saida]
MSCPNLVQSFTICNMRHLLSKGPTTTKVSRGGRHCQCPMLNGFPPLSSVSLSTHAPPPPASQVKQAAIVCFPPTMHCLAVTNTVLSCAGKGHVKVCVSVCVCVSE